jgi:predicted aconitase with swiveling domain
MSGGITVEITLIGKPVVAGSAEGTAIVSNQPISFWGGVCPRTGEIIDRHHERLGAIITGKVFVFPQGKGSSTASATLMQSIKAGTGPAAIINLKVDPILALGAILADEVFQKTIPIIVVSREGFDAIQEGDYLFIKPDGTIRARRRKAT